MLGRTCDSHTSRPSLGVSVQDSCALSCHIWQFCAKTPLCSNASLFSLGTHAKGHFTSTARQGHVVSLR